MTIKLTARTLAQTAAIAAALTAVAAPAPALAAPDLPYGPDTCIQGLVWREARAGDTVCVTPGFRSSTAAQNSAPYANKVPASINCVSGFVWREAFDGDIICVTPDIRSQNWAANAAAQRNYQRNN